MREKITKKSRGFGFIVFENKISVDKLISSKSKHIINGKVVECKAAVAKEEMTEEQDFQKVVSQIPDQGSMNDSILSFQRNFNFNEGSKLCDEEDDYSYYNCYDGHNKQKANFINNVNNKYINVYNNTFNAQSLLNSNNYGNNNANLNSSFKSNQFDNFNTKTKSTYYNNNYEQNNGSNNNNIYTNCSNCSSKNIINDNASNLENVLPFLLLRQQQQNSNWNNKLGGFNSNENNNLFNNVKNLNTFGNQPIIHNNICK